MRHAWYLTYTQRPFARRCFLCGAKQWSEGKSARHWQPRVGYCTRAPIETDEGRCTRCSGPYTFRIGADPTLCGECWEPTRQKLEHAARMRLTASEQRDKVMRQTLSDRIDARARARREKRKK